MSPQKLSSLILELSVFILPPQYRTFHYSQ